MKAERLTLHSDRFLGVSEESRAVARRLFAAVEQLPIISPHGHTDPRWFANNIPFDNPTDLLLVPDHTIFRLLYSHGVSLESLRISTSLETSKTDPREAWRVFANHYALLLGTPSRIWLDHLFAEVFALDLVLSPVTADDYYDQIDAQLKTEEFLPRAILDRFKIEFLATTEGALDPLDSHQKLAVDGLGKRVVSTFRPDDVIDPDANDFTQNLAQLAELTGENTATWQGYLAALGNRREYFSSLGATASDHGHPSAQTANLLPSECQRLLDKCLKGTAESAERELFRGQMLTEMAAMSIEDGMVMQLHPGSYRNHNDSLFHHFGKDKGGDIPVAMEYVKSLKPLLDRFGNSASLSLILFTLDESTYSRELAPLAGHYPCIKLGPAWWFHDSPEGMLRYRQQVSETAGIYNTVGFNDDTRALLSIPVRHDLARRMDCQFLSGWVTQHRITEEQAVILAQDLAYRLPKSAYKVGAPDA